MENTIQEKTPATEGAVVQNKTKNSSKMFLTGLAGVVLLAVVILVGTGIFRAYVFQSTDKLTVAVAKVLRLPIAKVNDKTILYTAYVNDLKAINTLAGWQAEQGGGLYADADKTTLSDMVIEKLVGSEVINQVAKDMGATIDEKQVDDLLQTNIAQFDSEEAFNDEVKAMYGWSREEYLNNAVRPTVLQYAIEEKVQNNADFLQEVRDKMDSILAELQGGADFSELASKYNEDNTASSGGDLGWFREDEMDPQFAQAAFSLKPGETTTVPVESYYGLHLIKVEDRKTVDETNDAGEKVQTDEIKARHIFLSYPNSGAYLRKKIDEAQIHLYGRIHNPFELADAQEVDNSDVVATEGEDNSTPAAE